MLRRGVGTAVVVLALASCANVGEVGKPGGPTFGPLFKCPAGPGQECKRRVVPTTANLPWIDDKIESEAGQTIVFELDPHGPFVWGVPAIWFYKEEGRRAFSCDQEKHRVVCKNGGAARGEYQYGLRVIHANGRAPIEYDPWVVNR